MTDHHDHLPRTEQKDRTPKLSAKRLKKIARRIIDLAHTTERPDEATLYGRVYQDTGTILAASGDITTLTVENDLPEDISYSEVNGILKLFPEGTTITTSSIVFDDEERLSAVYDLLRSNYGEPVVGMNAYRYIGVRHPNDPNPYGLDYEFFVVGLHSQQSSEQHGITEYEVLGKASLEPVFLDAIDGLTAGGERFATPQDLAKIVTEDRKTITHTLTELQKAFE